MWLFYFADLTEKKEDIMERYAIIVADGLEEVEALTVVDLLRRASIEIDMVSIMSGLDIRGAHGIDFKADKVLKEVALNSYAGIILPGGMGGVNNIKKCTAVIEALKEAKASNRLVAAICAGPTVLGVNNMLENVKATCYPGLEGELLGAKVSEGKVAADKNIITSKGPGTAMEFAIELVRYIKGEEVAASLTAGLIYNV